MASRLLVAVPLLLLACAVAVAKGDIYTGTVREDNRPLIQLTRRFGFKVSSYDCEETEGGRLCAGGHLRIDLSNLTVHPGQNASRSGTDLNKMALFFSEEELTDMEDELSIMQQTCALEVPELVPPTYILIHFSDSQLKPQLETGKQASLSMTKHFTDKEDKDLDVIFFYIYFGSCDPLATPVSFNYRIAAYNVDSSGRTNYQSVGDAELGIVYWVMFSFFTVTTAAWFALVWKNRVHAQRIHYLMGILGFFKAMTLMSQAVSNHYVAITGYPDGWNIAVYIFTFFRTILFFTIIILIGTGWSYMKPFLGDREKRILMLVVPLQVFANIAIIIRDEESVADRDWLTWWDLFRLVDIICCCAILFPIVWSIKNLQEAAQTDGKAARSLEKLVLFRQFYVMVVVYIYFTRIVVYLLESPAVVPAQYAWISSAADELATLAFYVWTAISFRPHEANPYLRLPAADAELEMR